MNQFRSVSMIARTTPGTHNLSISAQTVTNRLRRIGGEKTYTMYVLNINSTRSAILWNTVNTLIFVIH